MKVMVKYTYLLAITTLLTACGSSGSNTQTAAAATSETVAAPAVPKAGSYSNINNAQLEKMMKDGVTVIDIRREEEWKQTGIIADSKPITFFQRNGSINQHFVPAFQALIKQDQPVILICRTGSRTRAASQAISQQLGYTKVYNVTHGITSWIRAKRPVTTYQ